MYVATAFKYPTVKTTVAAALANLLVELQAVSRLPNQPSLPFQVRFCWLPHHEFLASVLGSNSQKGLFLVSILGVIWTITTPRNTRFPAGNTAFCAFSARPRNHAHRISGVSLPNIVVNH